MRGKDAMIPGVDVSDFQGHVEWSSVAWGGRQFAFTKATEGTDVVSPTFARNWVGIRAARLIRGAYHFAKPDNKLPEAEADFFLQEVGPLVEGDLLALDLESGSSDDVSPWALAWLKHVTVKVGFRPLLYSGTWFLEPHGCTGNNDLAQYGL